ncbi:MAG TPA: hypothetical protein VFD30_06860 [Terriglobia bacterium]|nr:hypothetical protein [Terriglobia bacterium]
MHPKPNYYSALTAILALAISLGAGRPASAEDGNDLHLRGKIRTVVLIGLLHASVTLDAWSTNRLFNNHPPGYRPVEYNPLLSPFAGKPSMYLMANLLTIPTDLFLLKYRRHPNFAQAVGWANIGFEATLIRNNLRTLDKARNNWQMTQAQSLRPAVGFTLTRPQVEQLQSARQQAFREMFR